MSIAPTDKLPSIRPIRSFVQRHTNLSKPRQIAFDKNLSLYTLPLAQGLLQLECIFQRTAKTTLEIGFGMGHNILAQAQKHPDQNFLGIEVYLPGIATVLMGIERLKLANLRIFCADAIDVFDRCIADNTLDTIQIFFPDPWPKKKHHKRRLIQAQFIKQLQNKLKLDGQLQIATDWENYAKEILSTLEQTPGLQNNSEKNTFSTQPSQRVLSKFEQRGQLSGRVIYDLVFNACAQYKK